MIENKVHASNRLFYCNKSRVTRVLDVNKGLFYRGCRYHSLSSHADEIVGPSKPNMHLSLGSEAWDLNKLRYLCWSLHQWYQFSVCLHHIEQYRIAVMNQ